VPARVLLLAALTALLLAPAAAADPPQARSSIVGGQDAAIGAWPSIAFVLAGWDSNGDQTIDQHAQCTGTVIAPQWVVSAAHCAFQPNGELVHAMLTVTGVADLNEHGAEAISVDDLEVHPNWDPDSLAGDALLIHLRSPSSRTALPIARHGGDYVTVPGRPNAAGWGAVDEDATIGTDVLQEAYLELQDDDLCAAFAPGFDPATQTCAGTANTAGACKGDSGGPLLVFERSTGAPVLWGLTSYGPQIGHGMKVCALQAPAVFSWVPGFAAWMTQTIAPPAPPAPPPPPPIQPPPDTTAPRLAGVKLAKKRLRPGRRTRLSFRLSEASAVTATVLRRKRSRLKTVLKVPFGASAGTVRRGFAARAGSKRLRPGRYVLRLVAVDTAGNRSRTASVAFRVIR
jgi:secreted trypsin-like serine protease